MVKTYVVSIFLKKSRDNTLNTTFGIGLVPDIYYLMSKHKNILFLVPYDYPSSESVMRAVHSIEKMYGDVLTQCWAICNCSVKTFYEKTNFFDKCVLINGLEKNPLQIDELTSNKRMVDMSDFSIFYIENPYSTVYQTMKYAEKAGKNILSLNSQKIKSSNIKFPAIILI